MLGAAGLRDSLIAKSEVAELGESKTKPQSLISVCRKAPCSHLQERLGLCMGFSTFRGTWEPSSSPRSWDILEYDAVLPLSPVCRQRDGGMMSLLMWGTERRPMEPHGLQEHPCRSI